LEVRGYVAVAVVALSATIAGHEALRYVPPSVVKSVNAAYTPEARAAKIEGSVKVAAVVLKDGTVGGDVKVVQSLDTKYGLDDQAVKAAKQWGFKPATQDGEPTSASVTIELTFTL
jgi:protein TonB